MTESVVTQEIAEKEFEDILKAARLKWDRYLKKNGDSAIEDKEEIVNAIMDGEISVNENGFPTVHTHSDDDKMKELKFHRRLLGRDLRTLGKSLSDEQKFFEVAGRYFGVAAAEIEALEMGDIALIQMLWIMFLRRWWTLSITREEWCRCRIARPVLQDSEAYICCCIYGDDVNGRDELQRNS